jgi:hypothetical protein
MAEGSYSPASRPARSAAVAGQLWIKAHSPVGSLLSSFSVAARDKMEAFESRLSSRSRSSSGRLLRPQRSRKAGVVTKVWGAPGLRPMLLVLVCGAK